MLFERNGGAWSQLGDTYNSGPLAAGTQLMVIAVGATVALLENGVERIAVGATDLSGGAPGIFINGTGQADNWGAWAAEPRRHVQGESGLARSRCLLPRAGRTALQAGSGWGPRLQPRCRA
jgi:hypothetical protein